MLLPPPGMSCQAHRQLIYGLAHVVRIRSSLPLDTSASLAAFNRSPLFSAPFVTIHPPSTTSSFSHGSIRITHFHHSGLVNCHAFRQTNALPVNSARRHHQHPSHISTAFLLPIRPPPHSVPLPFNPT
ncbi:hypothetical protein BDN70DRAFT_567660 [Pholiota conissans]|uniref:Uncharacterized protein n=1 Tax=Pholiota conissans TaxID=109636 RepID=A0A9P6CTE4_9AGAR|nr:hypothetical protein BDN70DRAFT_567660 [Pholiota conissans]